MCKKKNLEFAVSAQGTNYYVVCGKDQTDRSFGILATYDSDNSDETTAENLFFTKEEAYSCCRWLAENNVEPLTLCEVLDNFYRL